MNNFKLTEKAETDLRIIREYLAQINIDTADELIDRFMVKFTLLANHPLIGISKNDIASIL